MDVTRFHNTRGGDDQTWYGATSPRLSFGKTTGKDLSFTLFGSSLFEFKDVLLAAQYERGEDADVAEAAKITTFDPFEGWIRVADKDVAPIPGD